MQSIIPESVFIEMGKVMFKLEPIENQIQNKMERTMDSCVHLLGHKQDLVYTKHNIYDDYSEWNMVLFDGHGSVGGLNPYTNKFENYNLVLLALQEMMKVPTGSSDNSCKLDRIIQKDVFSIDDNPAIALQRALGKICIENQQKIMRVGATMVLVKVRHNFAEKTLTVDVLSVGDSSAVIYANGEKVLESDLHNAFNITEIERLVSEGRVNALRPTIPGNNFEILDETTICKKRGLYVDLNDFTLAVTQSIGHIDIIKNGANGKYEVKDECGVLGLKPYVKRMTFSETDEINIKLFSDGVSDMIDTSLVHDSNFMPTSNACETADLAKERWQKFWHVCVKSAWCDLLEKGQQYLCKYYIHKFGNNADDVSCISWIQTKK